MAKKKTTTAKHSGSNKHLAILYGDSSRIAGIMAGLHYDGLSVIGAIPLSSGKVDTPKHETENYLIRVISEIATQTDSGISNIHLLRLPCDVSLDAVHIVSELTKMELGCNISNIRVETEGGCRAFLEESCSLIPSSVSEGEVSKLRREVEGHLPILVSKGDPYVHAVGEADLETGDQGSGYVSPKSRLEDLEDRLSEVCSQLYVAERDLTGSESECRRLRASIKCLAEEWGLF